MLIRYLPLCVKNYFGKGSLADKIIFSQGVSIFMEGENK